MYDLLTYLQISSFISSLIAWQSIKKNRYLKLFPLLLLLIAAGELFGEYWAKAYGNNTWFYNLYDPAMLLLYFAVTYRSITGKGFRKFILAGSIIYVMISICSYPFYYQKKAFNEWMYISGVFILVICIVRKLYELLEDPERLDFLKMPFFYILVFTLLFYTVTIPSFMMSNWMASSDTDRLTTIVNNANDFLNVLLYASYTIIFLWIAKTGIS